MADDLQGARDNFGQYYLAINPGYEWVEYQQERIATALEAVSAGDCKRLAVLIPPGHSKTQEISVDYTSFWMGHNSKDNAMTLGYSSGLATDTGIKVKGVMQSGMYRTLFPRAAVSQAAHSNRRLRTVSGGFYFASGFKGTVSGRRIRLMVVDDPIRNWDDAKSDRVQTRIFNDYKTIVKTRLAKDPAIILCATRWAPNDAIERILNDEESEWEVLTLPAENDNGTYLWEAHYGRAFYESAKKHKPTWNALYMQRPGADDADKWFKPEWVTYYDDLIKPGRFAAYMICDPALSKSKSGDRTSIAVFVAGDEGKAILVDWVWDRLDPDERTKEIIRLVRKWEPRRFVYEEYGLMADTFHLEKAIREAHLQCYPIAVGRKGPRHNLSKEHRIREMVVDWSEGKLVLPRKMERRLSDGETVDLIARFLDEEYGDYAGEGTTPHDDGLDTFSRLHEPELDFRYIDLRPSDDDSDKSYYSGRWPGSWESLF